MDTLNKLMERIKRLQILEFILLFLQLFINVLENIPVPPSELLLTTFDSILCHWDITGSVWHRPCKLNNILTFCLTEPQCFEAESGLFSSILGV